MRVTISRNHLRTVVDCQIVDSNPSTHSCLKELIYIIQRIYHFLKTVKEGTTDALINNMQCNITRKMQFNYNKLTNRIAVVTYVVNITSSLIVLKTES